MKTMQTNNNYVYILINHYNQPQHARKRQSNNETYIYRLKCVSTQKAPNIDLLCCCCCYNNGNGMKVSWVFVVVCAVCTSFSCVFHFLSWLLSSQTFNLLLLLLSSSIFFGCVRIFAVISVCRWIMSACVRTVLYALCIFLAQPENNLCANIYKRWWWHLSV